MKFFDDNGGYGACYRCDATKSALQISQCGGDCPFHARAALAALESAPTDDVVERVARAIYETASGPWEFASDYGQDIVRHEASAAIAAMGDGWRDVRNALGELGRASANYRHTYERLGGSDIETGRAWDALRSAEDKALTIYAKGSPLPPPPGEKP